MGCQVVINSFSWCLSFTNLPVCINKYFSAVLSAVINVNTFVINVLWSRCSAGKQLNGLLKGFFCISTERKRQIMLTRINLRETLLHHRNPKLLQISQR